MTTGLVRGMALSANLATSSRGPSARNEEFKKSVNARLQALEDASPGEEQVPKTGTRSLAQVLCKTSQCVHLVPFGPSGLANTTLCGWTFSEEAIELLINDLPHHRECDVCFQENLSESE